MMGKKTETALAREIEQFLDKTIADLEKVRRLREQAGESMKKALSRHKLPVRCNAWAWILEALMIHDPKWFKRVAAKEQYDRIALATKILLRGE